MVLSLTRYVLCVGDHLLLKRVSCNTCTDSPPARMTRRHLASAPLGDLNYRPATAGALSHMGRPFFPFTDHLNSARLPFDSTTRESGWRFLIRDPMFQNRLLPARWWRPKDAPICKRLARPTTLGCPLRLNFLLGDCCSHFFCPWDTPLASIPPPLARPVAVTLQARIPYPRTVPSPYSGLSYPDWVFCRFSSISRTSGQ